MLKLLEKRHLGIRFDFIFNLILLKNCYEYAAFIVYKYIIAVFKELLLYMHAYILFSQNSQNCASSTKKSQIYLSAIL